MKKIPLYILCFAQTGLAQSPFGERVDSLIRRGIDLTFQSEFDSALIQYRLIENELPDHPAGPFYIAATYQSAMLDYETDRWETEFYEYVERAVRIGEDAAGNRETDAWLLFYLGNAYCYKGLYQSRQGALIAGFTSAHRGISLLEKAVGMDSTMVDPLLLIGNYKYWAGRYYKYIRWLPFIRDERELGVEMIRRSIRHGSFSRSVGINTLGWIEYDRKNYTEALSLFETGLNTYPGSRFFLWGLGAAHQKLEQWEDADRVHEKLLESVASGRINNGYNEAEIRSKLMLSAFAQKRYDKAAGHARAILDLRVCESIEKRIRDHRKQAARVLKNTPAESGGPESDR